MKFEYRTVEIDDGDSVKEDMLDEYGRGGYELVCVLPFRQLRHTGGGFSGADRYEKRIQLIFKRRME